MSETQNNTEAVAPVANSNPVNIKASITDGTKHVVVMIQDLAAIANGIIAATGHPEIANIAGEVESAIAGMLSAYADASVIEITPESINSLLVLTPLAGALDSLQTPAVAAETDKQSAAVLEENALLKTQLESAQGYRAIADKLAAETKPAPAETTTANTATTAVAVEPEQPKE